MERWHQNFFRGYFCLISTRGNVTIPVCWMEDPGVATVGEGGEKKSEHRKQVCGTGWWGALGDLGGACRVQARVSGRSQYNDSRGLLLGRGGGHWILPQQIPLWPFFILQGPGALATEASKTHAQGSQGHNDLQSTDSQEQSTDS